MRKSKPRHVRINNGMWCVFIVLMAAAFMALLVGIILLIATSIDHIVNSGVIIAVGMGLVILAVAFLWGYES